MSEEAKSLLLKRPVQIKVVVTPRWKEEVQAQLNNQIGAFSGPFHSKI